MRFFNTKPDSIPSPADSLPGRTEPIMTPGIHTILGTPLAGPWPEGTKTAIFGLGCFWGDEKDYWQLPGVVTTAVGYAGGHTPNPTYQETCTGRTGHAEVVLVAYDPAASATSSSSRRSGSTTTRPRACARATMSAPSTARSSSSPTLSSERPPRPRRRCTRSSCQRRATARSRPRSSTPRRTRSTTPRTTTSSTCDKNPRGYCPNHATGVKLPDDFVVTPLQYVD